MKGDPRSLDDERAKGKWAVELVVKNPYFDVNFSMFFDEEDAKGMTLAQVRKLITKCHRGGPLPEEQRIICAGMVLKGKDEKRTLGDIVGFQSGGNGHDVDTEASFGVPLKATFHILLSKDGKAYQTLQNEQRKRSGDKGKRKAKAKVESTPAKKIPDSNGVSPEVMETPPSPGAQGKRDTKMWVDPPEGAEFKTEWWEDFQPLKSDPSRLERLRPEVVPVLKQLDEMIDDMAEKARAGEVAPESMEWIRQQLYMRVAEGQIKRSPLPKMLESVPEPLTAHQFACQKQALIARIAQVRSEGGLAGTRPEPVLQVTPVAAHRRAGEDDGAQADAPHIVPAQAGAVRPERRRAFFRRIGALMDFKLMMKLALFVFIFGQDKSNEHIAALVGVAFVYYLLRTGIYNPIPRIVPPVGRGGNLDGEGMEAAPARGDGGANAEVPHQNESVILTRIVAFIKARCHIPVRDVSLGMLGAARLVAYSFVCSLAPPWRPVARATAVSGGEDDNAVREAAQGVDLPKRFVFLSPK